MENFDKQSDNIMFLYTGEKAQKPKSLFQTIREMTTTIISKAANAIRFQLGKIISR